MLTWSQGLKKPSTQLPKHAFRTVWVDIPQTACPLLLTGRGPRQTQPSANTALIFRTQRGQASPCPHASVVTTLSLECHPACLLAHPFLCVETSLSCHLLHGGFSDLSPSYKRPLSHVPKYLMPGARTCRLFARQPARNKSMPLPVLQPSIGMVTLFNLQSSVPSSSGLWEGRNISYLSW